MTPRPDSGTAQRVGTPPDRDPRFLTFLGGTAMADIGDQAWIVILAFAAAQSGSPLTATLTVAAGTVPRAVLDLVGGSVADRLPTRPLLVFAALGRVLALALGLLALTEFSGRTIPVMVLVAVLFGAADALHKPAVGTFPRQLVAVGQLVRAASLRQLVARVALLVGPALAGVVLAAVALPGAVAGLLAVFAVAAVLLSLVRPRYRRDLAPRQSVVASTREVVGYLREDAPARALVYTMIGLNFFVIPVINAGIAIRVHKEGWGAGTLGVLMASIGVGAVAGTLVTLRIRPRYPMRFALILLVAQGVALALAGVLPVVGSGISLGLVGLTAGLSSPMLGGTTQAIVKQNYLGRIYSLYGLADDALIPFALVGYGAVAGAIGVRLTTVLCGVGMAVLMGTALLRRPLRMLRLDDPESVDAVVEESLDPARDPVQDPREKPTSSPVGGFIEAPTGDPVSEPIGDRVGDRLGERVGDEDASRAEHRDPAAGRVHDAVNGTGADGCGADPVHRRSQRTSRAIG